MTSFKDHISTQRAKLMIVGDSGSGKTASLASLANAGYNVRILDFDDGLDIPPLLATRQLSGSVFEPFDGLGSDTQAGVKDEPEKLEAFPEIRDPCFGLVQRELELPEDFLDIG